MATIKGESGVVFIWDTVGMAYKPIACLTSAGLDSSISVIESNTKCFPGVTKKEYGMSNFSIPLEGEYIDTTTAGGDTAKVSHDKLLLLQLSKEKIDFKYDTNILNPTSTKYYGKALITELPLTQGAGDELSTFSATFDVDGSILLTDPKI